MNINLTNDLFANRPVSQQSHNFLLPKILKFITILVGIVVSVLITYDISTKLFEGYSQDSVRILSIKSEDGINFSDQNDTGEKLKNISNVNQEENIFNDPGFDFETLQRLLDQQKELVMNFYNKVDRQTYRGKWHSQSKFNFLSERTEGEIALRIEKVNSYSTFEFEKVYIVFRLLDGHYIDRWTLVRSLNRPFWNYTSDNNKTISQKFTSVVDFGEIFEKVNYQDPEFYQQEDNSASLANCKSTIDIDWNSNVDTSQNISHIIGSFSSNCGFSNFTFNLDLEKGDEDYFKVMTYSVIVTLLACSQIFNTIWLTYKISDSQTFANSISLFTVLQNIVWNAYGCLCHFFLTVNYEFYSFQFGIPAFLFFTNFSIFEIKLLYSVWRIKNMRYMNDQALLRKKLIQFYFAFYIVMFFSLFYVMKFFFEKPYIFSAIIFTWIPQIIYNAKYKNKLSIPIVNIFLMGLNKIFLPFYFRGCPENFFQLSHDFLFLLICFVCLVGETLIMYCQSAISPRWFLPASCSQVTFDPYKSKAEVLAIRPDAELHDCVICLFSLLSPDNYKHFTDDFEAASERSRRKCNYLPNNFKNSWLNFHEASINLNRKPYMMTPCRHFFHTPCLDSWFKQKKECPSCRQDIEDVSL